MSVNGGLGTLLQHGTGSPTVTYATIAQRTTIDGPNMEVGSVETTNLDSTWKEYRPTLPDGGEVTFTIQFDKALATHDLLFGLIGSPSVEKWRIQFPDDADTKFSFEAFVTAFGTTGVEVESNIEANVTLKITGPVTDS